MSRVVQIQAAADLTMRAVAAEILHGAAGVWDTGNWQRQILDAGQGVSPPIGQTVAVWGPAGAPGRTSVAIALADEFSREGSRTFLVDADTYAPAICFNLGIIEDSNGIVVACRNADNGTLNSRSLQLSANVLRGQLQVLGGIPRSERWPDLRHSALTSVWDIARATFTKTVIDVGPCVEDEGGVVQHGGGTLLSSRRNAAAITGLSAADVIVAVTRDDPLAITRLIAELPTVKQIVDNTPVVLALIRSGDRRNGSSAITALQDGGINLPVVVIPFDAGGYRNAVAQGALLAEVAPRSPTLKGVKALSKALVTAMAGR